MGVRGQRRVIDIGTYKIQDRGNSLAVYCLKPLENRDFPSDPGEELVAEFREEGPDGCPEVVLKPTNDEQ